MVGSVHYMHDISIDSSVERVEQVLKITGGLEALSLGYYEYLAG